MSGPATARWRLLVRALRRRFLPGRPPVIAEGPGRGLCFDPGPGDPAMGTGRYEAPVQAALAAHLAPGDVVLDIGANTGFLAVVAANLVGARGRVVAFEPVPDNARLIRRNARLNGLRNLAVVEAAVSDRSGDGTLVLARHAGGAALAEADLPPDACGERAVRLVTVDDWIAGQGGGFSRPVRLLKVDVEGAEPAVLRGAAQLLAGDRPLVLLEVDAPDAAAAARKFEACRAFLADRGYAVERLPDSYPGQSWSVMHLLAVPPAAGSPEGAAP